MSSPADTVDQVFRWLRGVFDVTLPTLPLPGVYRRFTALFDLTITGPLPAPTDPLPWTIPVAGVWDSPLTGLGVSIVGISIRVADGAVIPSPHIVTGSNDKKAPDAAAPSKRRNQRSRPPQTGRRPGGRLPRPFGFLGRP